MSLSLDLPRPGGLTQQICNQPLLPQEMLQILTPKSLIFNMPGLF